MNHHIQNHMLMGRDLPEFREPSATELASAIDAVLESYIAGDDRWELHRWLGEHMLESLFNQARALGKLPERSWSTIVVGTATAIVSKWGADEWANYRERGAA